MGPKITQSRHHLSLCLDPAPDLLDQLGVDIVPYLVLLVVPVMGRMSDQDAAVRLTATHSFATLIRLIPLEVRF